MEFDATQALELSVSDEDDTSPSKSHEKTHAAQLKVTSYEGQSEQLHDLYKGENVIGRRSESHITIPAKTISKRHAIIEITDGVHMIHDLGSINKTRRGKIVLKAYVRYELQDSDVLRFGDVTCIYTKMSKQIIASDSDTDPEPCIIAKPLSTSAKSQMNERLIAASDSGTGLELPIKISSPLTNSNTEQKAVVMAAMQLAKDSDSDTGSESLIGKPPPVSSGLELNNNVNNSKQLVPKESELVTARSNRLTDFMKTGIILSDSECSESDEEVAATNAVHNLQVPETPAGEIKQTTSLTDDSSPAVAPKRFNLGRLISSSDSDTDIDDEIKIANNADASKKETGSNSRELTTSADSDACEKIADLLSAETQVYPENVAADFKSFIASKSPPLSEKQQLMKGPVKAQPTIIPVDNNMDWLELPTQPNMFNESFGAEDKDEVAMASTSKSAKSVTEITSKLAGDEEDWASMATQPYILSKTTTADCLQESDEDVDIFDAATQMYPASRIEARAKTPVKKERGIEKVPLADSEPINPIQCTDVAVREIKDMRDLALADTVPIELFDSEWAAAKGDEAAPKPELEEPCFNSPPCTDEETIKLKAIIAEVLTSPALALSQEILGDNTEYRENAPNPVSDNEALSESPVQRKDDKSTKTKVAKGRAPRRRARAGRMSNRRRKKIAAAPAEAQTEVQTIAESPQSAFRAYRKAGDNENALAEPKDIVDMADIADSASGSKDTLSRDAGDSKEKSPTVIRPRRSTAGKYRCTLERAESDSSDNPQVPVNRRRALRGSALKKAAAAAAAATKTLLAEVRLPLTSKLTKKRRVVLAFDSSDDDTANVAKDQGSSAAGMATDSSPRSTESAEPKKPPVQKATEKEVAITESQWQRLEEEIAELSGEGNTYRSAPKSDVAAVPLASAPLIPSKGKGSTSVDVVAASKDTVSVEAPPAATEAKAVEWQMDMLATVEAGVPARSKGSRKSVVTELPPEIRPCEEGEAAVSKASRAKSKRRRVSKTPALQPEAAENLGENLRKDVPTQCNDSPAIVGNSKKDIENEPETPEQLPADELSGIEATSKGSPRRRRSPATPVIRSPKAKKSSKARKQGALADTSNDASVDGLEDSQKKKPRRRSDAAQGMPRLLNIRADAKVTRSHLRQLKRMEDSSDSKNLKGDKRVSWSQEMDAEKQQPEGEIKAGRTSRGAKVEITENSGMAEQSEGRRKGTRSAKAKAKVDAAAEEEKLLENARASHGSKNAVEGESGAVNFVTPTDTVVFPTPRTQRKSTSKYRRLVITSDSAVDSTTTEYESESSPVQKAAPTKRLSAAQRRANKAKADLEEAALQEGAAPGGKSPPKRVAALEQATPAKRRRGPAAIEGPGTKAAVAKRSRISKPETPAAAEQSSDTESLDEFEVKLPSPVRGARGKASTATKKTPQKKGVAAPEVAPKSTPRRAKGSPRAQPILEPETLPKIMFTGISEKNLENIVKDLNGSLVDSVFECTHLVTDKVRRTWKFLCMLARGCHIVSPAWLKQCKVEKSFIDAAPYVVIDESAEKQYKFKLKESLTKARNESFLNGYRVHATKSVKPPPEEMQTIIKCAGGTYLTRMPTSGNGAVVVTCPEDLHLCNKARNAGVAVVGTEFILTGVLRHVVEIEPYRC